MGPIGAQVSCAGENDLKISIITPSFNQVEFIGRTIESVLSQRGGFDLELLVVDGNSTDGSVNVIRQYAQRDHRLKWVSGPDRGQFDAVNKGLRMASGDAMAFLNSDDLYRPGALQRVARAFEQRPDVLWLCGKCRIIDRQETEVRKLITLWKNLLLRNHSFTKLLVVNYISQPATFWRRAVVDTIGYFDVNLNLATDYEYWCRLAQRCEPLFVDEYLADFRVYAETKTMAQTREQLQIEFGIAARYTSNKVLLALHRLHNILNIAVYRGFKYRGFKNVRAAPRGSLDGQE